MAQPSVAREPSMEEILASIRRIIESNDPGGNQPASSGTAPIYGDAEDELHGDIRLTIDDEDAYAAAEMVAANDPGPAQVQAPVISAAVDADKSRNISLADLAARVRSASERVDRPAVAEMAADDMTAAAPRAESPVMTSRMAELRAAMPRVAEPQPQPQVPAVHAVAVVVDEDAFEAAAMADVEAAAALAPQPQAEAQPMAVSPAPERAEAGQDLKSLVSAATIEQVSRSFGELAAAIDGQQRRSLDEMAEEMLRPMLQEWLDDNLPTLVERLVREEIERVARGPRR
ncbi:MAG: PopZ family protein [Allorhizobium sp.]